jgi:hypothetical protein
MSIAHISFQTALLAVAFVSLAACGPTDIEPALEGDVEPIPGSTEPPTDPPEPPEPASGGDVCIISADCPKGTHCDLGECVQACSSAHACDGRRVCSARGRCLEPGEIEGERAPVLEKSGEVQVTPVSLVLSEKDEYLSLTLSSDSDEPVRYRIVPRAPHLSIAEPRGEFSGETTVELDVDASEIKGADVAGTVRVITNLGEVIVDAPLRGGISGRYEGAMQYEVSDAPLGEAQLVVDLQEDLGDVSVAIDPERSLLFPAIGGVPTYGEGIYTLSEGVEVTVTQLIPAEIGGERNHFGREIGREITFKLTPSAEGVLEGTFEERIFGLLEQPITVIGTVFLRSRPVRGPLFFTTPAPHAMPTVSAGTISVESFSQLMQVPSLSAVEQALPSPCPPGIGPIGCLEQISDFFYAGLRDALTGTGGTSQPLGDLSDLCKTELYFDVATGAGGSCVNAAALVAALHKLGTSNSPSQSGPAALFHATLARLLAPHLLVAQDELVRGVRDSFLGGASDQVELYQAARNFLSAPARFALQPAVLEFLRRTSAADAAGVTSASDASLTDYPAFRALARLLFVLSSIEGELSSLAATNPTAQRSLLIHEAQERAVLTVLEASTLSALIGKWSMVPAGLGTELVGALTPLDRGFGTLLHGDMLFGVPEGEIPLAFDPARAQPTNFEQMLLLRAAPALEQQAASQLGFLGAGRDFEQTQDTLAAELEQVRARYEETIHAICGVAFDIDTALTDEDWQTCGKSGTGSVAEQLLQMELLKAQVASAYGRIEGIKERIEIEYNTHVASSAVRKKTLRFVSSAGEEREAMAETEGAIDAAQEALELASNSSLWNGFTGVALGVASGVLELTRTQLVMRREELAKLQSMRVVEEGLEQAEIESAARTKTMLIDIAQIQLDMQQLNIQILQASVVATNLLDTARRAAVERARVLHRIKGSPAADPIYRTLMHDSLLQALSARREAQRWLYRSGRALEYEMNTPFGEGLSRAVLAANNQAEIGKLSACFLGIYGDYATEYGIPQEFKSTLSVRELLGVSGPREDEVTGQTLDEGQLFRGILLQNQNLDGQGGVGVEFSTNLEPGNELWSSGVCSDKIVAVRAKLVGDFLGDDEAELELTVAGGGVLRSCGDGQLVNWTIDSADRAIVQAGVNSFGDAAPNTTLYGQAVARPNWRLFIPGPDEAPTNGDLDLERIDDIVLEVTHRALPGATEASSVSLACLGTIGSGG